MAAQQRSSNRNYIDLVEDERYRQSVDLQPVSARPLGDYLLRLLAALRLVRNQAG